MGSLKYSNSTETLIAYIREEQHESAPTPHTPEVGKVRFRADTTYCYGAPGQTLRTPTVSGVGLRLHYS